MPTSRTSICGVDERIGMEKSWMHLCDIQTWNDAKLVTEEVTTCGNIKHLLFMFRGNTLNE